MLNMLFNSLMFIALIVVASVTDTSSTYWRYAFDYYSCWAHVRYTQVRAWVFKKLKKRQAD